MATVDEAGAMEDGTLHPHPHDTSPPPPQPPQPPPPSQPTPPLSPPTHAEKPVGSEEEGEDNGVGEGRRRRRRRRKPRPRGHWKPYSELTWEEKRALEEKEERRVDQEKEVPSPPHGRKKQRPQDFRPRAPRNTTQFIMGEHELHPSLGHEALDALGTNSLDELGTMEGLVKKTRLGGLDATSDVANLMEEPAGTGRMHMALLEQNASQRDTILELARENHALRDRITALEGLVSNFKATLSGDPAL